MPVTVWWASPRDAQPWHRDFLSPAEVKRAEAYRREEDRDRFTTANALLHLAAWKQLGSRPVVERACSRCGEPHGKPAISAPTGSLHVSVSHSGDLIAVALTELGPIGVDVEETKRHTDIESMLGYVFSPAELAALERPSTFFYQAWTRKESILKATGEGLHVRMSTLTVLPHAPDHNVRDLTAPRPGYAAAVTVLAPDPFTVTELDGQELLTASPPHQ
ncbi:MAG TPA: 4'-phosphopantetheinyl transferase superfamily protein [Candidatus Limnocylindrales bacterium]|nr:4'-phosphopantetheinyl transferase superfamily protein [Candidatus Limnocylindrales bacterium]